MHGRSVLLGSFVVVFVCGALPAAGQPVTLSVSISPTGGGTVTVSPPGTSVSSSQSFGYDSGAPITLEASPNPGFIFDSWSGDISASGPVTTLLMNMDRNVVANFVPEICTTFVPDLFGLSEEDAGFRLVLEGLAVGATKHVVSETVPEGQVVEYSPSLGEEVPCGSAVDLCISSGPCSVTVPDFSDLPADAALDAAVNFGLDPVLVVVTEPQANLSGLVVDQSIEPGAVVGCNSRIEIAVYLKDPANLCIEWQPAFGGKVVADPPGQTKYQLNDDLGGDRPNCLTICPEDGTFVWHFPADVGVLEGIIRGTIKVTTEDSTISFLPTEDGVEVSGRVYLTTGHARATLAAPNGEVIARIFDINFRNSLCPPDPPEPPPPPKPPVQNQSDHKANREYGYVPGQPVRMVALANQGFEFEAWAEPQHGQLPFVFTQMQESQTATALFRPSNRSIVTLQTDVAPEDSGTVAMDPPGQLVLSDDMGSCFRLSPNTGMFTLCLRSGKGTIVEMGMAEVNRAGTVVYFDDIDDMGLSVCGAISIPDRAGFVTVSDPVSTDSLVITDEDTTDSVCDCADNGDEEHAHMSGTRLTLYAAPAPGYAFGFWTGPVDDPTSPSTTYTIAQDTVAFANFVPENAVPCVTSVPGVTGLTEADATAVLVASALNAGSITKRASDDVPAGQVISQAIDPGTIVPCGTPIDLVVSTGPDGLRAPDLIGTTRDSAEEILSFLGLRSSRPPAIKYDDTVPPNTVLEQSPPPGTRITPKTPINFTVSTGGQEPGRCRTTMPNLTGLTEEEAVIAILRANLELDTAFKQFNDTVPAGEVFDQSPVAGTELDCGLNVSIFVSLGPEKCETSVPDVEGLSEADAKAAILAADLTLGPVRKEFSDTVPEGDVAVQDPPAGFKVECGLAVDIYISRGPKPR